MSSVPVKTAVLHRMVMDKHICPFGLKSLALLRERGFTVDDHWLTSRDAVESFKAAHNVKTTPQTFIDGARIGGYDDLRRHFGLKVRDPKALTYTPVIAVFATAALMAAAAELNHTGTLHMHVVASFIAFSMCLLALLKLRDVETFSNTFLGYDLLARRWIPYAYIYPFAELTAGVLMIAGTFTAFAAPLALFIGSIGAVSVIKAVYIDKRELKCACVGGDANVPLGFLSLTENLMMVGMAIWMLTM